MSAKGSTKQPKFVSRVTLDVPSEDLEFVERLTAYRNAWAEREAETQPSRPAARARSVKVSPEFKWERKGVLESFIEIQVETSREYMKEVAAHLGPLPPADDKKAVAEYAARAHALKLWQGQ